MRLVIATRNIQRAAAAARAAAPSRSTAMPILHYALLSASGDSLAAVGTDMDIGVSIRVPAAVDEPGTVAVPADLLADIASQLPDTDATLSTPSPSTLRISAASTRVDLVTAPPDDFPAPPALDEPPTLHVQAAALRALIRRTRHAISRDESRPALTGALLEADGSTLSLTATDGARLSRDQTAATAQRPVRATIPARALAEWERILGQAQDSQAALWAQSSVIAIAAGSATCWARPIAVAFPNYQNAIPKSPQGFITVQTAALRDAVRRALVTARDSSRNIELAPEPSGLRVASSTPEVGATVDAVPATADGSPSSVYLNGEYLVDALATIDAPRVIIETSGPTVPIIVRPDDGSALLHLIAPIRMAAASHA